MNGGVLRRRVDALQRQYTARGVTNIEPSFVLEAVVCLLKNRFLLRGLTAFRHYLFDHNSASGASSSSSSLNESSGSRGSLGRALGLGSDEGSDDLRRLKKTFDLLNKDLAQCTESLANVAGRRTFRVPHAIVVDATDSANYVRRRMKQYLRAGILGQRTFRKNLNSSITIAGGEIKHESKHESSSSGGGGGESKTEKTERVEEKVSENGTYISTREDCSRIRSIDVPVRGLHASLRQLSDGTTSVLPLKMSGNRVVSLRTASSASSEEGRDLFRSSLSGFDDEGENEGGDGEAVSKDAAYWERLEAEVRGRSALDGESKEQWCGPKCKKGHKMVHSTYKEDGYSSGYVCDECRGRSAIGHRSGSRNRWFCKACHADICFNCYPPTQEEAEVAERLKMSKPLQCRQGHDMVQPARQRRGHSCDLCGVSIRGMMWRCGTSCDYDICLNCWNLHENSRTLKQGSNKKERSFPTRSEMLRPINRVHPLRIGELVTDKQMKSMDEDEESLYQVLHVPAMIPGIRTLPARWSRSKSSTEGTEERQRNCRCRF
jgi:hypothetical protein